MRRYILSLLGLLATATVSAQKPPFNALTCCLRSQNFAQGEARPLPAQMAEALREEGLVGVVWSTVAPDGSVTTGAAGLKDARRGTRMIADDRVQVGSVTKALIATGVLRLVTEGKLTLDTRVEQILPDIAFDNPWGASDPLLIRHLLDHTSGLDDARLWQLFSRHPDPDTPLAIGIGARKGALQLRSRPGSRFSYSNMGYTALGMVIEAITGERYETYLDTHLLAPLGMTRSSFRFVTQEGPQADTSLAMGHFEDGMPQRAVPMYLRPAGQFATTAADMASFARFLMGNGEVGGAPFIDPSLLRAMGTPVGTEAAAGGLTVGYGLGLARRDRHGVVGRCHGGDGIGYVAMFCLFPDERKAFFVSINADAETADYDRFDALLVGALGIAPTVPPPSTGPLAGLAAWEGIYVLSPSRIESFAYLDVVAAFATVTQDGAHLRLEPFQGAVKELTPVAPGLFRSSDRATASHVLLLGTRGERVISDGFRSYARVSPWRVVPLWASLVAGLLGIAYLLMAGAIRAVRRTLHRREPIFVPVVAIAMLLLPVPFFLTQSFLHLGDLTLGSGILAFVTGALPVAMAGGLWRLRRRGMTGPVAWLDLTAMLFVLQWSVVLATWGLLPLRLWA